MGNLSGISIHVCVYHQFICYANAVEILPTMGGATVVSEKSSSSSNSEYLYSDLQRYVETIVSIISCTCRDDDVTFPERGPHVGKVWLYYAPEELLRGKEQLGANAIELTKEVKD